MRDFTKPLNFDEQVKLFKEEKEKGATYENARSVLKKLWENPAQRSQVVSLGHEVVKMYLSEFEKGFEEILTNRKLKLFTHPPLNIQNKRMSEIIQDINEKKIDENDLKKAVTYLKANGFATEAEKFSPIILFITEKRRERKIDETNETVENFFKREVVSVEKIEAPIIEKNDKIIFKLSFEEMMQTIEAEENGFEFIKNNVEMFADVIGKELKSDNIELHQSPVTFNEENRSISLNIAKGNGICDMLPH